MRFKLGHLWNTASVCLLWGDLSKGFITVMPSSSLSVLISQIRITSINRHSKERSHWRGPGCLLSTANIFSALDSESKISQEQPQEHLRGTLRFLLEEPEPEPHCFQPSCLPSSPQTANWAPSWEFFQPKVHVPLQASFRHTVRFVTTIPTTWCQFLSYRLILLWQNTMTKRSLGRTGFWFHRVTDIQIPLAPGRL